MFPFCVCRRRRVYHNSRPDEALKTQIFREVYANVYFKAVFLANVYFTYTCERPHSAILSLPARVQRTERKSLKTKKLILIALAATSALTHCAGKEHEWPQLPEGTLPDSEVSTNVTLHVNMSRLDEFALRIMASNCASNEMMVAIGHDADDDGDLSFDETAFVFGIDCGVRYFADYAAGRVSDEVGDALRISHQDFDPSWNLAKVVKRGEGEVDAVVTEIIENKRFSIRIR